MAKRLITAGCAALLALIDTLGAGQALAASSPPFVDNGNGTVTDTSTGLMWDQCSWGQNNDSTCSGTASNHNWTAALGVAATASGSAWKGYSDWRLPNIDELKTLVKLGSPPTIDTTAFPNTQTTWYWSASASAPNPAFAWIVYFVNGNAYAYGTSNSGYVRLVRSGQYFGSFGLFPSGISGVTVHSATLTATSAIAATGSWLVLPRNATPPSAAQVIAGASYGAVTVAAHGSAPMAVGTPASFTMGSLTGSTNYDLYLVAQESTAATTSSVAGPIQFSTLGFATRAIVIDPVNPAKLYAALDGLGVYASSDSSATWTPIIAGLSNLNLRALALQDSSTLFAATYDGGVFKGTFSGSTWTWTVCGSGLSAAARLRSLSIDTSGNLYAGSESGIYQGSNNCVPWVVMNTGLPN